jgi:GTP cyclohydrolase II
MENSLHSEPKIASSPLKTKYGAFTMFIFSWSDNEQDNILVLQKTSVNLRPLVRIQSACYSGEIFESTDCDCHWQLERGLELISKAGGYFIDMLQDGRGAGLLTKIRGMRISADSGIDTAGAYLELGSALDPREYSRPSWILSFFGVKSLDLLTNNPRKSSGLMSFGFDVNRVEHESFPTDENQDYLRAKKEKLGHLLKNV